MSNQASSIIKNLKQLIDKLQSEKSYFITQVEKLKMEKKQLTFSNKSLTIKINMLQKDLQRKISL